MVRGEAKRVPGAAVVEQAIIEARWADRAFPVEADSVAALLRDAAQERAATSAEAMLRALSEASPNLLYAMDRHGRLLYANPATLAVIGRPAPEVLGRTVAEWHFDPAQAEAVVASDQRIMAAGITVVVDETFTNSHRGETRLFESTKTPLREPDTGEVIGLVGISRDVTEERRAKAALAGSEARFRALVNAVPAMTWEADASGTMTWLSDAWAPYCGRSTDDLLGCGWLDMLDADDRAEAQAYRSEAMRTGQGYTRHRRIRRASDGMWRWHLTQVEPVRDADGTVTRWIGSVTDVHDLVEAQAKLRKREEVLRLFVERAPAAIGMFDTAMRYLAVSRRFVADHQFDLAPEAMLGRSHYDLFPDIPERWREVHRRVLTAGETISADDDPFPRADGSTDRVRWEMEPWYRADGAIGGALLSLEVITARVEAEHALAASEERLRALADVTREGILVHDRGLIVECNTAALRLLGVESREAMIGREVYGFVAPSSRAEAVARVQRGGEGSFEATWCRADGAGFPVEVDVRAATYRGRPVRVAAFRDLIEQKAAAAALRESEARFRATFEQAAVGIAHVGLDGRWLRVNARLCAILGYEPAELLTRTFQDITHAEDLDADLAQVQALFAGRITTYAMEKRYVRADGSEVWANLTVSLVRDDEGTPQFFISVVEDIADRRAAEAAVWRSEARLAQATKMEALGRLAGGIAHDFNNVLHVVQNGAGAAAKRLSTDPESAQRYLGLIRKAADRGAAVTGRLLAFARQSELKAEPIAPRPLLEGLVDMLCPTLGARIALSVAVPSSVPALVADRSQLEAVLINLANNARDAMPNGGPLVLAAEALSACAAAEALPDLPARDYVRLAVIDAGTGMPSEVMARVTEPFFTTKPEGKGTGLGLAMARGFAEQSGGGLTIESVPGKGTAVMLWLPQVQPGEALADGAGLDAGPSGVVSNTRTLLLVDDQQEVRTIVAVELTDSGHAVTEAEDAAAALALIDGGLRPDALITDLTMPGCLDGLDLVLTARARLPQLPVLLVTGHAADAMPGKLAMAAQGGPFAVVRKPASVESLLGRLQSLLHAPG